jgi:DNA-binding protein H-NS
MKQSELHLMTTDQLWALHEAIVERLTVRITAEKSELEKRLQQLSKGSQVPSVGSPSRPRGRRPYPRVLPKYRNPAEPSESWSGRGKKPRWLLAQLDSGHTIEEFEIGDDELRELLGSPALVP